MKVCLSNECVFAVFRCIDASINFWFSWCSFGLKILSSYLILHELCLSFNILGNKCSHFNYHFMEWKFSRSIDKFKKIISLIHLYLICVKTIAWPGTVTSWSLVITEVARKPAKTPGSYFGKPSVAHKCCNVSFLCFGFCTN